MYNSKCRYICRRHNIIKHLLLNKIIADPLTKGLSRYLVYNSSRGISLKFFKDERG